MKIKKELIKRQIAEDTVLIPVGKAVYDTNGLFALNAMASFLWDHLPDAETEQELCDAVLAEYEISRETVCSDVAEFLAQLRQWDIID